MKGIKMKKILILFVITLVLAGCATQVTGSFGAKPVGFWHGFWHGYIILFSFIGCLFNDRIIVYLTFNNHGWYNFGFFLGISSLGGSSASSSGKKR